MKGVNFFGPKSEYIISGSDCSNVFLWEKESERIVQFFEADVGGVVSIASLLMVVHYGCQFLRVIAST